VVAKIAPAYIIDVHGSLKIDSVKITSWDPTTNYYTITNGSRTGSGVFIFGAPRPSIVVENNATGTTDITNSEIAYLGYEQGCANCNCSLHPSILCVYYIIFSNRQNHSSLGSSITVRYLQSSKWSDIARQL
jgi:hypothetical protein